VPDDDDEKPAEDSGSLVDFTPFTPTAKTGQGLALVHFSAKRKRF
jgi:hypothetical protein